VRGRGILMSEAVGGGGLFINFWYYNMLHACTGQVVKRRGIAARLVVAQHNVRVPLERTGGVNGFWHQVMVAAITHRYNNL
jgi:hypothetical protein